MILQGSDIHDISISGKREIVGNKRYNMGSNVAFYNHKTKEIKLVSHSPEEINEIHNRFKQGPGYFVHRTGFKVRPRRSIKQVERQLPGFKRPKDVAEFYARVISHESTHKALAKIGEHKASRQFDDIRAAKGYHGVIRKPTRFLIGEGRYPERVNVTPIKPGHRKQHHNKLSIGHVDIGNIKIRKFI